MRTPLPRAAQLEARSSHPDLSTLLAIAQHEEGSFDEAIATLVPVLDTDEGSGAAYLHTGLAKEADRAPRAPASGA